MLEPLSGWTNYGVCSGMETGRGNVGKDRSAG